eukprot:GSChrysophyteH1.ASY1.ANO1.1932.1 assembled CDS
MTKGLTEDCTDAPEHAWGIPILWRTNHIPQNELESMRGKYDEDGDGMLDALVEKRPSLMNQAGSSCLLEALEAELNAYQLSSSKGINIDSRISAFFKSVCVKPDWLDMELLKEGQLVYMRYSTSCSIGLLYFSLIGGFSAPKIVKVLDATGYLTKSDRDSTWKRLNETIEMVVDCLSSDDALEPEGVGWWSVLKVRMLHSRVRRRLIAKTGSRQWDTATYGVPINQEDMMGTLLSFSINVLRSIQDTGAPWLTTREQQAYLHLWRYIGHLIGVHEEYNPCTSVPRAAGAVESVVLHLLMKPDDRSRQVAFRVLSAVADRKVGAMKKPWSYSMHAELARYMLGEELAHALGIEAVSWRVRVHAIIFLIVVRVLNIVIPPLIHKDGWLGPIMIKHTRAALRRNVDSQLYPEKSGLDSSGSTDSPKREITAGRELSVDRGCISGHDNENDSKCPFGFK